LYLFSYRLWLEIIQKYPLTRIREISREALYMTEQDLFPPPEGAEPTKNRKFVLPDWIPADAWAGFVDMRKKLKAPLTPRAITLLMGKLEELRTQGNEPGAVLDQSTERAWRGVFALHNLNGGYSNGKPAINETDRIARANAKIAELGGNPLRTR
jgi:hypothetical protein